MYRAFNIQIISEQCPNDKAVCPVQEYFGKQQLLRPTVNESLYSATNLPAESIDEFVAALRNIQNICADCKNKKGK